MLARVEARAKLVQEQSEQRRLFRHVEARDITVAAREAVEAVQAALRAEIDGQVPVESLLELEQRDVVARVHAHALSLRLGGNLEEAAELRRKPLELRTDTRLEPIVHA